ncbi:MAG: cyclic nucleotide-binding domain-containing protein [Candidatus Hydrogenedens sp.]|nr:cyclic nucleotide-binding domain-containing protein [Candidatus Hydrogenedens sp.]
MTEQDDLRAQIKEHPLLHDLSDAHIAELATCAVAERFQPGEFLIRDRTPADKFFLIRHGTLSIELETPPKGRLVLQTVHEGDGLGWSWLVPPHRWAFDARAMTLVRTVTFDANALLARFEANHELGYQLLRRLLGMMAHRLTAARLQMLDLYGPPPAAKV